MKNSGIPIVQEGFPFLGIFLLTALAFSIAGAWSFAIPCWILAGYVAFFFRNPERLPPVGSRIVASPADGRVIYVGRAKDPHFGLGETLKISVFMSLFDVHVNRFPLDGTVRAVEHKRGRFLAAFEETASHENERVALLVETNRGEKVAVTQVAGLIARRIICYPAMGSFVLKGQRYGLIRFGSRCDMYLPLTARALVKTGDRVLGGESVIAELAETAAK